MILVDVEVPSVGRKYQFNLDEQSGVETLITEMAEVICQKEQCRLLGNIAELSLCAGSRKKILDKGKSLSEQGVENADWLILI